MAQANPEIQRYLSLTNTQGGADTFNETSVATEILPENGLVYKITGIDFMLLNPMQTLAADFYIQWSLTRDTKTAAATIADPDSFLFDRLTLALTTSGAVLIPNVFRYQNLNGLYIVEPTIYAQLQSATTGLTLVADWRVYYEEVKMNEIDILRVLNNS